MLSLSTSPARIVATSLRISHILFVTFRRIEAPFRICCRPSKSCDVCWPPFLRLLADVCLIVIQGRSDSHSLAGAVLLRWWWQLQCFTITFGVRPQVEVLFWPIGAPCLALDIPSCYIVNVSYRVNNEWIALDLNRVAACTCVSLLH